jgi:1-acyl-sn-glycerol-3-phosphate acyltransferase
VIYVVRYLLIVVYTLFWGGLACVVGLVDRSGESAVWMARRWVDWILRTCGIEVEASGLDRLDPAQPYVFMSNHQSVFDIVALVATIPRSFRFVAKHELTRIPVFGWALVVGGHVIVDRRDRERAIASLERAAAKIRRGTSVIVFPEGTRSPSGALAPFKSGGFHLVIAAQVPVVPVSVSGSRSITPKRSLRIESGRIRVHFGAPIATEKLDIEDRAWLKEQVREAILAGLESPPGGSRACS